MYPLTNILSIPTNGQAVLDQVIPTLRRQGWQVVRSFDLQTARQAHTGCSCPHHGTDQCSCQMAVFLIYGESSEPLTLVAHGRDGQVELSLVDDPAQSDSHYIAYRIRQVFLQQPETSNERSAGEP